MLRLRGHDTRTAPSGHAALHILRAVRPTLIILDLCIPDIDGLSILQMLRSDPGFCQTRVIVFSGADELVPEALASGAHAAFVKGVIPGNTFWIT
jgi:CheY-like chemotaxis protein